MKLDPMGYAIAVMLLTALSCAGIAAAVHTLWLPLSYATAKALVLLPSLLAALIAFVVRRRAGG